MQGNFKVIRSERGQSRAWFIALSVIACEFMMMNVSIPFTDDTLITEDALR